MRPNCSCSGVEVWFIIMCERVDERMQAMILVMLYVNRCH